MHTVAFSEVLLSRLCRLLLSRVSTHSGACFLEGASPPGSPLRLLRGSSSHGDPRRLLKGTSPPGDHHQLSGWCSLQSHGDLRPTGRSYRELFSPQRDSHSSRHRCYEARDSVSPQQLHSSWASSQDPYQGLFRSLLAGSFHHDSRHYLRFVEKNLLVQSSASG